MRDALSTLGGLIESGVRQEGSADVIDEKAARSYFGMLPDETLMGFVDAVSVSYTHLDVYKRQIIHCIP